MRLRRKPWIDEAIKEYADIVIMSPKEEVIGRWQQQFAQSAPIYMELGTGKGNFITGMAAKHPNINFVGIEAQQDVLFYAAKKVREQGLTNVRLMVFDINHILELVAPGEVSRFYINFCDPWPKARHAKRRLTHTSFLDKYRQLLPAGHELHFKTDNRPLFDFSLEQFSEQELTLRNCTYDLHDPAAPGHQDNIMTEYEKKFSEKGTKINRVEVIFS